MAASIIDIKKLENNLQARMENIQVHPFCLSGKLTRSIGLTLEAKGIWAPLGTVCHINNNNTCLESVVTGFTDNRLFLMPIQNVDGLPPGAAITPTYKNFEVPVGFELLGRVIDSCGVPLDGKGALQCTEKRSLYGKSINPMHRRAIEKPLDVGVRAINAMLTVGQGQRLGLMAGSGVGKSVLLGMLSRNTVADIIVVGLIGERGREVKEFIDNNLGDAINRAVVIAAPADYSPLLRLYGAWCAMTVAEYFREKGKNVLLLMDSVTRFAQAQREIGLAMNEPPATKGFPPSAFTILPRLIERAGNGSLGEGSITAIFTVLAEGDDQQDPIVDAARAVLDGHIVLSRKYADLGHYPAIDIEASVSRVMSSVTTVQHRKNAILFKKYYSLYLENRDLVNMGAYVNGMNPDLDYALKYINVMETFLQQDVDEKVNFEESVIALENIIHPSEQ